MTASSCLSCEVIAGHIQTPGGTIFEDDLWSLTHSISPVLLAGFLILQPKRHVEHIGELSADEASGLGHILSRACRALQGALKPEKVYVCSFGSLVKHVHFYLIPRMPEMPGDLSGDELLRAIFDGCWACSDETAAELARGVREEIGIAARQN